MGDEFNINNIEKFICSSPETELSDISKIIKEMISIKNSPHNKGIKKKKSFDIVEKINLNNISTNLGLKIKKYHLDAYDVVDEALACLSAYEKGIRDDLYDYYWDIYIDVLSEMQIDATDYMKIKQYSTEIYNLIIKKINSELFDGKRSDIPANKKVTYIGAITAYVFYKCKFLIPIE